METVSSLPRIQPNQAQTIEMPCVSRGQSRTVRQTGGRNLRIGHRQRLAQFLSRQDQIGVTHH